MSIAEELDVLLRARATLIVIVTSEETRAADLLRDVCQKKNRPCYSWDLADGFSSLSKGDIPAQSGADPLSALEQLRGRNGSMTYTAKKPMTRS